MNHPSSPLPLPVSAETLALLSAKVRSVDSAIRSRFGTERSAADIDLLLVHYLHGLVTTVLPDGAPSAHLALLRHLAALTLEPDATGVALTTVPPAGDTVLGRLLASAETIGVRDAQAIRRDAINDGANAAPTVLIEPRLINPTHSTSPLSRGNS